MPRIFVPGPSANPSLVGSPAQYLQNINRISAGRDRRRIADERTAADKLFKDATIDLNTRKQDFVEAAPERAELQRLATLARENEKTTTVQNLAEGAQFAGGGRFDTIRGELEKDPRFGQLDEAGQLAAQNDFILKNPSALTPPKQFADTLRAGLVQSGQFTGPEIDAQIAAQVSRRYPTADPAIIKSLLAKPDFKIGSDSSGTGTGSRGGSSNFSLISDPTNPTARGDIVDRISETFGLDANPDTIFGQRLDIGDLDATKQDISKAVSFLSTADINSPTAQEAAINLSFNDDGTIKPEFDWRTKKGKENLIAEARKAQGAEERLFNKKGGDLSRIGASVSGQSAADVAAAAAQYNDRLLSRLTPQALTDSGLASAFLDNLGAPQDNTRQGGSGDGRLLSPGAPAVVEPAPAPAAEAELPVQPQAEFDIGGQVPADVVQNRIFNLIQEQAQAVNPVSILANAAQEAIPAGQKLLESLTPPGPGILDPGPQAPQAPEITSADLNSIPDGQRPALQAAAQQAFANGDISLDDAPAGGTIREKILIAYLKSLEGSRN